MVEKQAQTKKRINVYLNPEIVRESKIYVINQKQGSEVTTLTGLIEIALEEYLRKHK